MTNSQIFEAYFGSQAADLNLATFFSGFFLATILAFLLSRIYIKFGTSLSNRKSFANNFIPLTLTTVLIISIIKSSLALSLGLVGALSIVRFRAAIKEPEELSYIFLAIAIGLGFGANQNYLTLLSFMFISVILIIRGIFNKKAPEHNMYLSVTSTNKSNVNLNNLVDALKESCSIVNLKRVDKSPEGIEALLFVKISNLSKLNKAMESLESLDKTIKISFLEDKGIVT